MCLWSSAKKKPVASAPHSVELVKEEDHECRNWVSAVACCRYSDLAASGAADGIVRLWRADKALTAVGEVPIDGHVNGLQLSSGGAQLPPSAQPLTASLLCSPAAGGIVLVADIGLATCITTWRMCV